MGIIKLTNKSLESIQNIEVPTYNLGKRKCRILHIGVGNFHRSHQAFYLHELLQMEDTPWRICGAGLMQQDMHMKKSLEEQDHLYTLVSQKAYSEKVRVIGAIQDYVHISSEYQRFIELFTSDELKIISLTITEKGYCLNTDWNLDIQHKGIVHDMEYPDDIPHTAIGIMVYGLEQRMLRNGKPITIMSCDNIPQNGEVLKRTITQLIKLSHKTELEEYLEKSVKFPSSMVDRITPATTEEKREFLLSKYGILDQVPVFSEDFIQWFIEDDFNVERPEWERLGVQLVKNVKPYEHMKTRLLNGGHTALTFPSLLTGYVYVDDAINDSRISTFLKAYMNEVKSTLKPIEGIDYNAYIDELLTRFANPAIKDRLHRLAEDSSVKFFNFITPPLLALLKKGQDVSMITFALASWIVYLHESTSNDGLEVNDPIRKKLQEAATKSITNCTHFLSISDIFPKEIMNYKHFHHELNENIREILEKGIEETICYKTSRILL